MDRCGAESGHLVIFDLRSDQSWQERLFREDPEPGGREITIWGLWSCQAEHMQHQSMVDQPESSVMLEAEMKMWAGRSSRSGGG